jgi:WXG100 family type VII secretion target
MQKIVTEMNTTLGNLNAAAGSATNGWTGNSCTAFTDLWRRLGSSFQKLNQTMSDLSTDLHAAGTAYKQTDQDAVK